MSPYLHQHLLWSVFLVIAIPVGVKYLIVVLICVSPMTDNVEHLLMCFWLFIDLLGTGILDSIEFSAHLLSPKRDESPGL